MSRSDSLISRRSPVHISCSSVYNTCIRAGRSFLATDAYPTSLVNYRYLALLHVPPVCHPVSFMVAMSGSTSFRHWLSSCVGFSFVFPYEASPMTLHNDMFLPTLETQCSPQQRDLWLARAKTFDIIGTYAQTEMGHGMSLYM